MAATVNSVCMHRIDLKQQYHRDIVLLRSKDKKILLKRRRKKPGQLFCQRGFI